LQLALESSAAFWHAMHPSVGQYSFLLVTECTCILLQYHKQNYCYYYGSVYTGGTGMELSGHWKDVTAIFLTQTLIYRTLCKKKTLKT